MYIGNIAHKWDGYSVHINRPRSNGYSLEPNDVWLVAWAQFTLNCRQSGFVSFEWTFESFLSVNRGNCTHEGADAVRNIQASHSRFSLLLCLQIFGSFGQFCMRSPFIWLKLIFIGILAKILNSKIVAKKCKNKLFSNSEASRRKKSKFFYWERNLHLILAIHCFTFIPILRIKCGTLPEI